MSKILINTTASPIFIADVGVNIPAFGSYTIPPQDFLLWAASAGYQSFVTSGDLTVNDGSTNLTPAEGNRFIEYPDRLYTKDDGVSAVRVTRTINFGAGLIVTDDGDGQITITGATATLPRLREAVTIYVGGFFMNTESSLLYEADPVNGEIHFLFEQEL